MGIFIDTLSIIAGTLIGAVFREHIKIKSFMIFGISIMIISIVSFFENIFDITNIGLKSNELLLVVFALIIGTTIGDVLQVESKISNIIKSGEHSALIDSTVFFGIGGLQICGPVLMATTGDNSQLILKGVIDFPFALMFGMSYGGKVALSAIPVALCQLFILLISKIFENFFSAEIIKQLCSMGYIVLFFSGFNLICENKKKINNTNMIIGIFVILLYNIILNFWRYL